MRVTVRNPWSGLYKRTPNALCKIHADTLIHLVVFGDLASPNTSLDHDLVPIMKMIDLGLVEKVPTPK